MTVDRQSIISKVLHDSNLCKVGIVIVVSEIWRIPVEHCNILRGDTLLDGNLLSGLGVDLSDCLHFGLGPIEDFKFLLLAKLCTNFSAIPRICLVSSGVCRYKTRLPMDMDAMRCQDRRDTDRTNCDGWGIKTKQSTGCTTVNRDDLLHVSLSTIELDLETFISVSFVI